MKKIDGQKNREKMDASSKAEALEKLKTQREKLTARIRKMEAMEKVQERKRDVRRKILVGSYYLEQAKRAGSFEELTKAMAGFLKRDNDKALFENF